MVCKLDRSQLRQFVKQFCGDGQIRFKRTYFLSSIERLKVNEKCEIDIGSFYLRGQPSKTSRPIRGGSTNSGPPRTGGGRPLNRTSISDDFEQIYCVLDSDDTPTFRSTVVRITKYVAF